MPDAQPLSQERFPRAIVHFDGDSFFASVEQVMNHTLRGKPVITGAERGAVTSVSIEGKRLGLGRGMTLKQIREKCPEAIVVSGDYTAYALFARRMYTVVRRYTTEVEEYSIDECFADITGLLGAHGDTYEEIAQKIKRELEGALGITFGVGLAPTKVLAKAASKYRKPAGFTSIPANEAHLYLEKIPASNIWGIGYSMSDSLRKLGIHSSLDFAGKDAAWLQTNRIAKPYRDIWYELRGVSVKPVAPPLSVEEKEEAGSDAGSIMRTRTFSPPSRDKAFIYSQLSKNVEGVCARARQRGLRAREISFFLKTQDFLYGRRELTLPAPTADPREILQCIEPYFEKMFQPRTLYRATGITLRSIVGEHAFTHDLFGETKKSAGDMRVLSAMDEVNSKFGGSSIFLGTSLKALTHRGPDRTRKNAKRTARVTMSLEQKKKTLDLPFLGQVR